MSAYYLFAYRNTYQFKEQRQHKRMIYPLKIPTIVPQPYEICTKKNIKGSVRQYFQPNFMQADTVAVMAAKAYNPIIKARSRNIGVKMHPKIRQPTKERTKAKGTR